jgi:phage terminase small subunit
VSAKRRASARTSGGKGAKRKPRSRAEKPATTAVPVQPVELKEVEAGGEDLTPKQLRFCDEYLVDLNATQAAIRAGYSAGTAYQIGHANLQKERIQRVVAERMAARAVRTRISKDNVLRQIGELATYDIADAFTEKGAVKAIHDMPPALRNAISSIEVQELTVGEQAIGLVKKIKLIDRTRPIELAGRHLKLFTDKLEHSFADGLADKLTRARKRAGS